MNRFLLLWGLLSMSVMPAGPAFAQASEVQVRVLGVPGHELLLRDLAAAGYSASRYGPGDRPASGFQVVAIGSDVPAATAISVLRLAQRRVPTLQYVILAQDDDSIATKSNEITIGGTNRITEDFPRSRPLPLAEFAALLDEGEERKDLFYYNVRGTYMEAASKSGSQAAGNATIREDGVIVVPNDDGSAALFSLNGRRGFRTADGDEGWFMSNVAPVRPVGETNSPNAAWVTQLDQWLDWIGDRLSRDIELILADENSVQNYKNYEDQNADSLYERIHLRRQYLTILIDRQYN